MSHIVSEGGCLCGEVRYRIAGDPRSSSVCYCRSCRLASGAASVAWFVVSLDQFTLLKGSPTTFQSSAQVTRSFCARCGTPLSYQHTNDTGAIELTTATLDEPERWLPTLEIWHSHKLSWAASDPTLAHFPKGSP